MGSQPPAFTFYEVENMTNLRDTANVFGKQFQGTFVEPRKTFQGHSKKKLKPVIEHDGRVWIARYEGRPGRFFGASAEQAIGNLQAGGA